MSQLQHITVTSDTLQNNWKGQRHKPNRGMFATGKTKTKKVSEVSQGPHTLSCRNLEQRVEKQFKTTPGIRRSFGFQNWRLTLQRVGLRIAVYKEDRTLALSTFLPHS